MQKLIPAVAYYRMSSSGQEESVPEQRKAVELFAAQNGYRIIAEYVDSAISGDRTDKRIEFQRMIADAAAGEFAAILVWDIDRFGRFDSVEAGFWIHPLRTAGVKLVTLNDGVVDWTDFAGRLVYNVKQEGKHQFLRDLARNTMRNKAAAAKRGIWLGKSPLGYTIGEDGKLAIGDAGEVQLVRSIFAAYLGGESLRSIAMRLNAEGQLPRSGKLWSASTMRALIVRSTYAGEYRWGDDKRGKYVQQGETVVIESNHPAIVDRKIFDAAQLRLERCRNIRTPHVNGGGFVLTGLLRCEKCGGRMHGIARKRTDVIYYYCANGHLIGQCDRNSVRQDELLAGIVDALVERFTTPSAADRLRAALHKQTKASGTRASVESLRQQLAAVDTKLAKAKRRLVEVDSDMLAVVQENIRELSSQRSGIEAALEAARSPQGERAAATDAKVDRALALFARLRETLLLADKAKLRELLGQTIDRIEVRTSRVQQKSRLGYRFEGGVVYLCNNLFGSSSRTQQVLRVEFAAKRAA